MLARLAAEDQAAPSALRARVALLCSAGRPAEALPLLARLGPFDSPAMAILVSAASADDTLRGELEVRAAAFIASATERGRLAHPYYLGVLAGSRASQIILTAIGTIRNFRGFGLFGPQNATASYELLNRVAEICSICR